MIHVIATITVKPGTRTHVLEAFRWVTPLVRTETGCIEYQPTTDIPTTSAAQDGPRPDVVTVIEKWESVEALYAHSAAPHMTEYRAKVKDFVVSVKLQVTEAAF
jgi:quinol monooxygenase YgiN